MKKILWVLAAAPLMWSCTTQPSAEGQGAELRTNNVTGTVTTTLSAPLEASHRAAVSAMQDLKYTINEQPLDTAKGVVKATTADGTKVETTLEREGDRMTKLSVNAGITKADIARTVARKIQERSH